MAPEVALDQPYNTSVDAYSYGILFWQICSLQTPYSGYTQKMHADRVIRDGERPTIDTTWPQKWTSLMVSCWDGNYMNRPNFHTIVTEMEMQCQDLDESEGMIPTRTWETIRAKQKNARPNCKEDTNLDKDNRKIMDRNVV
jgi:hypothetical protein